MRLTLLLAIGLAALLLVGCAATPITSSQVSSPYHDLYAMEEGDIVHLATGHTVSEKALIDYLADHRVVYVGESHDSVSDHAVQLTVVATLAHKFPGKVAVGLEMMRLPFQEDADKWIAGELTDKEFMRVWQKNWGSSWPYYQELLTFLRDNKVELVALNRPKKASHGPMPTKAVKKEGEGASTGEGASKGKMDKMPTEAEMAKMMESMPKPEPIPEPEMDEDDPYYAAYIGSFFAGHGAGKPEIQQMFIKAQMLRDETMAETAANFLTDPANADKKLIVLAGGNHVRYGFGIPRRVFRRTPEPYAVVSPLVIHYPEDKLHKLMDVELPELPLPVADFAWLVPYEDLEDQIVKLGVGISDSEEPVGVKVLSVVEQSSAAMATLAIDDVIVDLDGVAIKEMFDLTFELSGKTVGETGTVTVLRGEERLTLELTYAVMPTPEP